MSATSPLGTGLQTGGGRQPGGRLVEGDPAGNGVESGPMSPALDSNRMRIGANPARTPAWQMSNHSGAIDTTTALRLRSVPRPGEEKELAGARSEADRLLGRPDLRLRVVDPQHRDRDPRLDPTEHVEAASVPGEG